jgi:formylglycine-generating enzyme required for sulfatase activity
MDGTRNQLLIDAWFDGVLTQDEQAELERALLAEPSLRARFWETAQTHALLRLAAERGRTLNAQRSTPNGQCPRHAAFTSAGRRRVAVAAAAALLLGAGAVLWKDVRPPTSDLRPLISAPPVRLVRQAGAEGLELPATLPGTLRLDAGTAWVRLASGVELALVGPLELEACDAMQVRLASGRLLASVPAAASGFTVVTPHLELWDLGTVFGVSVSNGVSDVFVFKGAVQVNEVSGEAVDLCRAGEGVRAAPGRRPYKVAADWAGARTLLQRSEVGGQRSVAAMLAAAGRIADLWGERNLPRVAAASPPAGNRGSRVASRRSKTITAPARGSAPEVKQEGTEMKGMTNTMAAVAAAAVLGIGSAGAEVPLVQNVTLAQPANTRLAVVAYEALDAGIATFQFKTGGVDVAHSETVRTVTGDISRYVGPGAHQFVWDAGRDFPEQVVSNLTVAVTLWATNAPPPYCAVGLAGEGFPVRWYGSEAEVPFGVTDSRWKKDWLLLRQVPSTGGETVTLGSPTGEAGRDGASEAQRFVRITQPFYMGVYPVTQRQWEGIAGASRSRPSRWNNATDWEERPVEQVSYYDVRENASNNQPNPDYTWPGQGHAVNPSSFMGRLRAKTDGILQFDLPTEAQWEYACRAGTTGAWNNGTTITNSNADANLDLLGRYVYNGGKLYDGSAWVDPPQACFASNATAKVGSYLPNAWGLHDMHGNVWEWCLDYYISGDASLLGDDPSGPELAAGSARVQRGGRWNDGASYCRSARRSSYAPSTRSNSLGFRVAAVAAAWVSPVGE